MNINWLTDNCTIYIKSHPFDLDMDYRKSIMCFGFGRIDDEVIINSFRQSLEVTKQWIMPVLNSTSSINTVIDYLWKYDMPHGLGYNEKVVDVDSEGMMQIKFSNADEYLGRFNHKFEKIYKKNGFNLKKKEAFFESEDYERRCRSHQEEVKAFHENSAVRKKMVDERFNDTDWCNEVFTELERRKVANTEILRSYGLNL